jgi:hypothetical protein
MRSTIDTSAGRDSYSTLTNLGTVSQNLTRPTKASQPSTTTINGRLAVSFVAANTYYFDCSSLALAQNITQLYCIAAFNNVSTDVSNVMLAASTAASTTVTRLVFASSNDGTNGFAVSGRRLDAEGSVAAASSGNTGKTTSLQVGEWLADWTNTDAFCWQNGTQVASNTGWLTSGATQNSTSAAAYVGRSAGTTYANMNWGESVVLRSSPGEAVRLMLLNWFRKRWGVFF